MRLQHRPIIAGVLQACWDWIVFDVFAVTLRELAELLLVLGALAGCLRAAGRPRPAWPVALGTGLGAACAAAFGTWLYRQPPHALAPALFTIAMALGMLLTIGTLLFTIRDICRRTDAWAAGWRGQRAASWMAGGLAALATVRECAELLLYLRMAARTGMPQDLVAGTTLAVLAACCLGLAWRVLRHRVSLGLAFRISALLLTLLTVEMLLEGIAELLQWWVQAGGPGAGSAAWLHGLLTDGLGYYWLGGVLAAVPLSFMLRRWWSESSKA